jgi:hypothetical protein
MRATFALIALSLVSAFTPASAARTQPEAASEASAEGPRVKAQADWKERDGHMLSVEARLDLLGSALTDGAAAVPSGDDVVAAGLGVGGGLRAGYTFMSVGGKSRLGAGPWSALSVSSGLDLRRVSMAGDYELAASAGEIDPQELREDEGLSLDNLDLDLDVEVFNATTVRVPVALGAQVGLGRFKGINRWKGVGAGLAWAPAVELVVDGGEVVSGDLDPWCFEAQLDFARLERQSREGHTRLAFTVQLPDEDTDATTAGLSFGRVWY